MPKVKNEHGYKHAEEEGSKVSKEKKANTDDKASKEKQAKKRRQTP